MGAREMGIKSWLFAFVVAVAAAYVAWPYYTLYRINSALETGEYAALEGLVDWPAVEGGMRGDIEEKRAVPSGSAESEAEDGSVTGQLAGILAPAMNDMLVQAYANPKGLARVIQEGKVDLDTQAVLLSEAQIAAREALEETRKAAIAEGDADLPPVVEDVLSAARQEVERAQAMANETYDSLRRDYSYLFFSGPTTFRAEYNLISAQQTKPLILELKLQALQWQLVRVHLPE
jgi:hypothetical protein